MANSALIVCTFFDRSANGRTDLLTVEDFRRVGRYEHARPVTWRTAARKRAERIGGAIVMLSCDSLLVFTKLKDGRIRQTTYKPGKWAWDNGEAASAA